MNDEHAQAEEPGNPDLATTWGTYSYITLGSVSALWTPHDRARAEQIRVHAPVIYQGMQILRWCAEYAGERLAALELDGYMDLGAGVPEEGYLHQQVLPGAPVLYNDNAADVVAKSQELLRDAAHVRYTHYDVREIAAILAEAEQHFGGRRKVGVLAVGLLYFLDDATVRTILQTLYDWCAPGSMLAITGFRDQRNQLDAQKVHEIYQRQGIRLYGREIEQMYELLGSWQPFEGGLRPTEDILRDVRHFDRVATAETRGRLGYAGFMIHP